MDQLEIDEAAIKSLHGMSNQPVFGSMIWIAPTSVSKASLNQLVGTCLNERLELEGNMSCSAIDQGISARYIGSSTQEARTWFFRIWIHIRKVRSLNIPEPLRVWPMQEDLSL